MDRRDFVLVVVGAAGGGLVLNACGGGGEGDASLGCTPSANFSTNHGHVLTVPASDVAAAVTKTYDIRGTADHTHSVTLTAALFQMLQVGDTVMVGSTASDTGDGHNHDIALRCTG